MRSLQHTWGHTENHVQACCSGGFTTLQDWVHWKPDRQHLCTNSILHVCKAKCSLQANCAKRRQYMLQIVTKASPVMLSIRHLLCKDA